ncbi:hypothetical protein [Solidesulfovibrio sp. C21]|uniref:hypothetical protein n=1 Tax=Solidesulfovibrio sp. C21 TaxID=3398613 RepID=UPI0039FD5DC9
MENAALSINWEEILPQETRLYFRHRWPEYATRYGLPFSRGTLQNLDSEGRGPDAVVVAGKVAYRRESLVEFLNALPVARLSKKRIGGRDNA